MKKMTRELMYLLLVFVMVASACNMPFAGGSVGATLTAVASSGAGTSVAQTVMASLGQNNQVTVQPISQPGTTQPSSTATLTQEPSLTSTVTLTPTNTSTVTLTPLPCNRAEFVSDVTIPDDTEIQVDNSFTKTWRLKNTGTCTWTSSYQLIFVSGDQMSGPANVSLTSGAIAPGGTVDVSVALTAPSSEGTYRGDYKLRAADGMVFGIGTGASSSFFVQIKAVKPTKTPAPSKPDLIITQLVFSPANPIATHAVHVKVSIYNQGYGHAKNFKVSWWGLNTFADPSYTWVVNDSLGHDSGVVLECNYTFASWYAPHQTTMVKIDTEHDIDESNESNNTFTQDITVVHP